MLNGDLVLALRGAAVGVDDSGVDTFSRTRITVQVRRYPSVTRYLETCLVHTVKDGPK